MRLGTHAHLYARLPAHELLPVRHASNGSLQTPSPPPRLIHRARCRDVDRITPPAVAAIAARLIALPPTQLLFISSCRRASQAPRLMRCHWRHCAGAAAAVDISPAAILPSAQLLCIFSCFSIANLGPTLDPAAYTSPRRSNWHASLSSRSCVASLSTKLRLHCTASPTYPCQSKLCAVSASVSL